MFRIFLLSFAVSSLLSCKSGNSRNESAGSAELARLMEDYYQQRMQLFPLEATVNGDPRYNDKLYPDFTDSYREKLRNFYAGTIEALKKIDRESLSENDKISYDFMNEYNPLLLEELNYKMNLVPTDQMWGMHLYIGQYAGGTSAQPFKTVQDYNNWLGRVNSMDVWIDSAIVYFRRGATEGITLPKPLVLKLIPQFESMVTSDPTQNLYYSPVKLFPKDFSDSAKKTLTAAYIKAINEKVVPMNQRMAKFLREEYLPKARSSSGYGSLPGGAEYYKLKVRLHTTTNKTPEEIYQTGLSEVARIRKEMEKVKNSVGFTGDLNAFFKHLATDPRFTPFKTPEEVLNAFRQIEQRMQPNLNKLFALKPTTPFEIRRTEEFRQESASAEYSASPDNAKPGIFYVPIIDATKFSTTSGMESLFLHEAIPGHHYQISLQRENKELPKIRSYDVFSNAYFEGWALYTESLGKELGLYNDPYQYMGALGDEMHRAIRLVVDVAIHSKGMTREEAIRYMMENEPISEQGATAEIERYMSGPGQALSYKTGALKIRELRDRYEKMLGNKFSISDFHTEILKDGSMPLTTLENKMNRWAESRK